MVNSPGIRRDMIAAFEIETPPHTVKTGGMKKQ
jgi:hypothetical protein